MSILQRILIFIMRLPGVWLQSIHQSFVAWTKPDTSSLLLGTLTDLSRSNSELVAVNALLRKPLIILRRQVKRPACTRKDRILLVLLAKIVRSWKRALFIVQPETRLALASSGLQTLLEIPVQGSFSHAKDLLGDRGLDQADGQGQPTVGSGSEANCSSWASAPVTRTTLRWQTHHSKVHEVRAHHP